LIIKAIHKNSSYQPGQRNFNWLKLKKDYLDTSIGDSLDLVPIGAEYGKGYYKYFILIIFLDVEKDFTDLIY
jgi:ATP-dependent DNA ligase